MSVLGIQPVDGHWVWFDEHGAQCGRFDQEAARWGSWITADEAARINGEGRLIDMEDVRAAIRQRLAAALATEEIKEQ